MANAKRSNKVHDAIASSTNFEWYLKPFSIIFNLMGLHIPAGKIQTDRLGYGGCAWIFLLLGGIFVIINLSYYSFATVLTCNMLLTKPNHLANDGSDLSKTTIISFGISWFNAAGYYTFTYLGFFLAVWLYQNNWKCMWLNLQEIQLTMNLDQAFYRGFRRTVLLSLILLAIKTFYCYYYVSLTPVWFWNWLDQEMHPNITQPIWYQKYVPSWLSPSYSILFNLTSFVPRLILSLFLVLVLCAADLLQLLIGRAKLLIRQHQIDGNALILASGLENWRRQHLMVCQFIRWINNCFGQIILLTVGNTFVSFIVYFYNIFQAARTTDTAGGDFGVCFLFSGIVFLDIVKILFLLYAPYKLKLNVRNKNSNKYYSLIALFV